MIISPVTPTQSGLKAQAYSDDGHGRKHRCGGSSHPQQAMQTARQLLEA
jgi:hypothetical protein